MTTSSPNAMEPRCPVCSGSAMAPYGDKDGYSFLSCSDCGYVFCHPRPSQQALDEMHAEQGGSDGIRADYYPKAPSRARRGLMNAFKLVRYVFGQRVLDLGCGGGFVVCGFKRAFAREAVGLDINPNAIEYARAHYSDCIFHCGTFDDFKDGRIGTFGFVYSSEVIEHVENVEAYMNFLVEITQPGAVVFINTPDIAGEQVPDVVTDWDLFSPPLHIQFFNEDTLTRLFVRFGFTPIKRVPDRGGPGLKMLFRKDA